MAINGRQGRRTSKKSRVSRAFAVVIAASVGLSVPASAASPPREPEVALAAQGAAPASEVLANPDDALSLLQPGQQVRVAVNGAEIAEGRVEAVHEGLLHLDRVGIDKHLSQEIPLQEVRKVWVRDRGTETGAIAGASLLGVGGAAFLGFVSCAMADGPCRHDWLVPATEGLLLGVTTGAIAGALLGSASPQWRRVYPKEQAAESAPSRSERLGSVSLYLGYAKADDPVAPVDGAAGWRLRLTRDLGAVAAGLEIGRYGLGSGDEGTGYGQTLHYEESLLHVGPVVSLWLRRGRVRPYAITGLGYYCRGKNSRWTTFGPPVHQDRSFLGASLGAGLRVQAAGSLSFGLESRYHANVTATGQYREGLRLVTLNAGATLSW